MRQTIYNEIKIYYFSGTGNAKTVAGWIKQTADSKQVGTEAINISGLEKRKIETVRENTLIGFCSPTHGFNFPPIMLHFIFRFPKAKQNAVFLLNTRAGMKWGRFFIPGLSGIALLLSALVLRIKGYAIIGMRSVDMPSSWISLHPGLNASTVESILIKRKKETIDFAARLLDGKKVYSSLKDIVQDVLISPISVLYYIIGRFFFAKSFIASKDCTHCNLCVEKCPVNAIKIIDDRCFWTHKCESCMQCMNICPRRAIETAHGFIIGVIFLVNYVIIHQLGNLLQLDHHMNRYFPVEVSAILIRIINSAIFISILFFCYLIMHYLLRFRFFERLFVFSSLTKYKFWRRYKSLKEI